MKKKKIIDIIICLVYIILIIMIILILLKKVHGPYDIEKKIKKNDIIELNPVDTYYLDNLNIGNITCTGLTYDDVDNSFWIADYGAEKIEKKTNPRLIEVDDKYMKVLNIIDLNNLGIKDVNLQGISYNKDNNSIYVAIGKYILELAKNGVIINKFDNNLINKYNSNGIAYNKEDKSIWSLLYSKYLIQMDSNGKIKRKINFNYKDQDHIFIMNNLLYSTIGASYDGNKNFVLKYNLNNGIKMLYRVNKSYAIEGIVILNNKMYIANDGFYHNAKIKYNYVNVYDLE